MTQSPKDLVLEPKKWWIDDLTQRVCAPYNHPELGFKTLPWPDSEKVYVSIDMEEYRRVLTELTTAVEVIEHYGSREYCSSDYDKGLRARSWLEKHRGEHGK